VRDLPSGTVTFLFTDVEGSTRLLQEHGDRYAEFVTEHRRILREAFALHGGVEVDTQGDAFFVAFPVATAAVAAAADAQAALVGGDIRVRMGLHTGEPLVTDEGYVGLDVHRAARICAVGHGGQVLLSGATAQLVGGDGLRDLGEHRLKDLTAPLRLFQLGASEFPPLKSLFGTNLPVQPGPLVGREAELAEAGALLRGNRLVTLTGPGGSGKTRLALQLAAEAVDEFPDGVSWVPLASVRDPRDVEPTIARALGAGDSLFDHLGDKHLLLLVDNVEQVIEAAPRLAELIARTSHAKLLVTSREPLRVAAERRFAVEPLPGHDAVELFVERARAVDPGFEPGPAVEQICRRLDGLPLAVELAAARVSLLSADQLLGRLDTALPLLTTGSRDAPDRQRTLGATIDWSYALLDQVEQLLFRKLAVFAASFELASVEAVCGDGLDALQSLVEKSLVRRWGSGRFGLLETIREYAQERLEESGEGPETAARHAEHYLDVARSTNLTEGGEPGQDLELAAREIGNFRRALAWSLESGNVELGLELATLLDGYWVPNDPYEGARWLEALLAGADGVSPELRARGLLAHGGFVFIVGEFERGTSMYERSLAEFRALGDERGVAGALNRLGYAAIAAGDNELARARIEEALEILRRTGGPNRKDEAIAIGTLADAEWRSGNADTAFELGMESAQVAGEIGFRWWQVGSLAALCEWSLELGKSSEAEAYGRDALGLALEIGDRMHAVYLLALLARVSADDGRLERAGLLWGALESEEERGPVGQWEAERHVYAARVLAVAGPDFERGRAEGRRLSLEEGVSYALSLD
jgi:predicted ATPase